MTKILVAFRMPKKRHDELERLLIQNPGMKKSDVINIGVLIGITQLKKNRNVIQALNTSDD